MSDANPRMQLKLYGEPVSLFTVRVTLGLQAKGLSIPLYELPGGGPRSEAFHRMNPIGKMPVLEVNGQILAESQVIAEYFEETHPGVPLLPADPFTRARCRLCARIVDLYIMPAATAIYVNLDPSKRDTNAVAAAETELRRSLGLFAHYMMDGRFAVSDRLTLADFALAPLLDVMEYTILPQFGLQSPVTSIPRLAQWWQHIQEDALCGPALIAYRHRFREFLQLAD